MNPIPAGSRLGPLLVTGAVRGVDRDTGVLPGHVSEQTRHAFANLRAVIEAGGGSVDAIVRVTVFADPGIDVRPAVNEQWIEMFPEELSRPARHLVRHELPGGMLIQLEALAYVGDADV
ncbi:MAG: RidA family protein [Frankia sp.]